MKKALLPALIAALCAASAGAADRELLFGPSDASVVKSAPRGIVKKAAPKVELAPTAASKVEPVVAAKVEPKPVAPTVAKVEPVVAAKVEPKPVAPTVAKVEPKPVAPAAVAKVEPKTLVTPVPAMPTLPVASVAPAVLAAPQVSASIVGSDRVAAVVAPSTDALTERAHLAATLGESLTVGFFQSVTGNNDNYSFQRNFLPLANYLSNGSGVLVNLVPERDMARYRKNILENRYPVIFINAALAREAIKADYVPVAVGEEMLAPGFLVKSESKFKTLADVKGAQISWSRNAQISFLAMADFNALGTAKANIFTDVGGDGRVGALNAVKSGAADVAVLRSVEVDKAVKDSAGTFRSLGAGTGAPSSGMWVRRDLAGLPMVQKLSAALLQVSPTATGPAKVASDAFAKGFGVTGQFIGVPATLLADLSRISENAENGFPDAFPAIKTDADLRAANLGRGAVAKQSAVVANDSLTQRNNFIVKMKEGMNVGFFASGSSGQDNYTFQSNFMPLSNYLSDRTGVLVSLVPERDANDFIRRIGNNDYAAIVIGPSLAQAALVSGYLPTARAGDFVSPGFLVLAKSSIVKFDDFAGKRIATVRTSDAATVGRWELLKRKVKNATFDFFGASNQGPALLDTGAVDAVLLRSTEALELAAKVKDVDGKPKFRAIVGTEEVPAVSVWVRHDTYDYPLIQSLADAFRGFDNEGADLKKRAFEGYVRGFGVRDSWQTSGIEEHTTSVEMIDGLIKAQQSLVFEAAGDFKVQQKNRARELTYGLVKTSAVNSKLKTGR